jgi:hypothetical protein
MRSGIKDVCKGSCCGQLMLDSECEGIIEQAGGLQSEKKMTLAMFRGEEGGRDSK